MAAIEFSEELREGRARYDFLGTLRAGWRAMRRHREARRTIVAISRLSPHVIRDMGLDPERVYEALNGSWDEVDPRRFRSHLPRTERV